MITVTKRCLITGITGQDGAYLAKFLLDKGYEVYGAYRRVSTPNFWRLQSVGIFEKINLVSTDLTDLSSIIEAIQIANPDECYNLAAQSFVEASFEQPIATGDVSGLAIVRLLEAIRQIKPDTKFYQASSSEMFGSTGNSSRSLTERDAFNPLSPYAAAKTYAHQIAHIYRDAYGIGACAGILFNHESPLRGLEFVTRKITNAVAKIKLGLEKEIMLGNLNSKRDWGYAPEYVEAMWLMLQRQEPEDYVVATDEVHSVREFVEKAFEVVGLNWEEYVKSDKRFFRPLDIEYLRGCFDKAKAELGWSPKTDFEGLVEVMVKQDLDKWTRWLAGERFPWDAPNYPSEVHILTRAQRM
jgi:GDPmannose 4,6-dehydratase